MYRSLVAVCSTAALLIFALLDSTVAHTITRTTTDTPASARGRASSNGNLIPAKSAVARKSQICVPCAARPASGARASLTRAAKKGQSFPCHPKNYIDPTIAVNYKTALREMNRAGIKPEVTSAWRSSETQEELYRCSSNARCRRTHPGLYRALPPGKSLHEAGFAVDMSGIATGPRGKKQLTSKGRRIVGIMRKNGFKWRYGLADPAHFETDPRKHGYRNLKAAIDRTRTTCQVSLAKQKAHSNKRTANKVATRGQTPARARAATATVATRGSYQRKA